jgi:hypothetical protein
MQFVIEPVPLVAAVEVPAPALAAAAPERHRVVGKKIKRQAGSRMEMLERYVLNYVSQYRGTPTVIAQSASYELGWTVSRQDVWRVLAQNGQTKKTSSIVPRLSVPHERRDHLLFLRMLWTEASQVRALRPHGLR